MTNKYDVLARINGGDETIVIGNVTAPNDRLAKVYAHNTFDEEDWDYLAVVRHEALKEVDGKPPVLGVSAE